MGNKELIQFLKKNSTAGVKLIDQLKISYRPLLCPFNELLSLIPEDSSVFDIGCGSGMFLSLVQEFKNPKRLGGIEISVDLIANAEELLKKKQRNVSLSVFDGKNIPESIKGFDYIFMIDVYHHIPLAQQETFMDNLIAKMSKGSYLVFKDIEGASILSYWNKIHDLLLSGEIGNEPSSKEMKSYFAHKKEVAINSFSKKRMLLYPHFTYVIQKI